MLAIVVVLFVFKATTIKTTSLRVLSGFCCFVFVCVFIRTHLPTYLHTSFFIALRAWQVQEDLGACFALPRLPEWGLHQHHTRPSAGTLLLRSELSWLQVVSYSSWVDNWVLGGGGRVIRHSVVFILHDGFHKDSLRWKLSFLSQLFFSVVTTLYPMKIFRVTMMPMSRHAPNWKRIRWRDTSGRRTKSSTWRYVIVRDYCLIMEFNDNIILSCNHTTLQ